MYTQIFKEILLDMEHDQQDIKDLVTFWQQQYQGNEKALKIIDEFQDTYRPSNAIWWYTSQCFTYQIINQALRTLDGDIIIRMGFYLCDVHRQIEELYNKQINQYHGAPDMVGVLFQMTIDPTKSSTPFASIREVSYYQEEEEILFSMHTVFRIGEVRKIDPKNPLYEVDLKLTADDDQQLHQLTNRIRQETCGRTGWDRMGQLL
ncbi:unnamed protein product, partial [Rotaria sp. Silwood1]